MTDDRKRDPGEKVDVKIVDRRSASLRDAAEGDAGETDQAARYPTYVEELKGKVEEAERRCLEVLGAHRQAVAEQEEFRSRLNRDVQRRVETETGQILAGLVEVFDDLDRAVRHAEDAFSGTENPVASALLEGVRLVRERFLSVLRERGVEKIELLGLPFDPATAEAIRTAETGPEQDGIVIEEIAPCFLYQGQLLRPARVTVGRAGTNPPPA
jgi:molecular chaperone GrpE